MKLSQYSNKEAIKIRGQRVNVKYLKYIIEYTYGRKFDWDKVEVSDEGVEINE